MFLSFKASIVVKFMIFRFVALGIQSIYVCACRSLSLFPVLGRSAITRLFIVSVKSWYQNHLSESKKQKHARKKEGVLPMSEKGNK